MLHGENCVLFLNSIFHKSFEVFYVCIKHLDFIYTSIYIKTHIFYWLFLWRTPTNRLYKNLCPCQATGDHWGNHGVICANLLKPIAWMVVEVWRVKVSFVKLTFHIGIHIGVLIGGINHPLPVQLPANMCGEGSRRWPSTWTLDMLESQIGS